ncbi:hypothetical protein [Kaistella jeonii]|uniref:Uncharacterized protein n=1 Tax=Kaistella jeonii TaxID=266749 RepID=A0A0C1D0K0_9FLAO|nr:hypothetical protein [Kaistella jeonii]KIA90206.1 hypothetical protein OA86_06395 [Kaistella jeonii]SFB76346.1 hypothetical protein SAMN05421876_1022 [Kaistella jeonii]VEI96501.1 Uncharacterised protein [Kaistella jeonii]
MKKQILFLLLLINSVIISGQTEVRKESIDYYFTYNDFVNNKPNIPEKAYITIKEENPNSIIYKEILAESTNKKIKKGYTIWGIKYKDQLFHNLLLTNYEIAQDHAFGKFTVTGKKFNVIILDTKKDKKAIGRNGNPYGGGLVASALYKPNNTEWKDRDGNNYKILVYNAEFPTMSPSYKENALVMLLTAKDVANFNNNDPAIIKKLSKGEYYLEEFLEFARKENE